MHVLSQTGFVVALLCVLSVGLFVVVAMSRYANPLDDELAHSIRESAVLVDSCAHTIDGKPLVESAFMELGAARRQPPARRVHLTHPASGRGAATQR